MLILLRVGCAKFAASKFVVLCICMAGYIIFVCGGFEQFLLHTFALKFWRRGGLVTAFFAENGQKFSLTLFW